MADKPILTPVRAGYSANTQIQENQETLAEAIADGVSLSGDVMQGDIDLNSQRIFNIPTPTTDSDVVNKKYVDDKTAASLAEAAASAAAALVSEGNASTSASAASGSAVTAASSATDAGTSATNAATSETNAATSETNAEASATNAALSAAGAAAAATAAVGEALSTGLMTGGVPAINGDTTKFDVTAGSARVVDNTTDPLNPVVSKFTWTAFTAETVDNIGSQLVTYLSINSSGVLIQRASLPTATQRRTDVFLGVLVHTNQTILNAINDIPTVGIDIGAQLEDVIQSAIGFINISGNEITANGANLSIDKALGKIFKPGVNFATDNTSPHTKTLTAMPLATFRYRTQDGTEGSDVTLVDPANYDVGGTVTAIAGSNNQATIQRINVFSSNIIRTQYGQTIYSNIAAAIESFTPDVFVTETNIGENGLLLGYLIVRKGATDLSDAGDARFVPAGAAATSASGADVQGVYNNSVDPELSTTLANGAWSVKIGEGVDTDAVYEGLNKAGTVTFEVLGNGNMPTVGLVDGRDIAADGLVLDDLPVANLADGTDGELITWSTAGAPTTVPVGTAAQVLTSNGVGTVPTFQDAAGGGGAVKQIIHNVTLPADQTNNSTTWVDVNSLTGTMTPSSTDSWIEIGFNAEFTVLATAATEMGVRVLRDSTVIFSSALWQAVTDFDSSNQGLVFFDQPSTTSAVTYKVQFRRTSGVGVVKINGSGFATDRMFSLKEIVL